MALDYAIQFPCPVRQALPEAKLFSMIKHKSKAEFAIGKYREVYPNEPLERILDEGQVQIVIRTPEGSSREMPVTIAQLLASVAPLEEVQSHCETCAANVPGLPFGCFGVVNYPLGRAAEEWLVSRLPDDPNNANLTMLFRFLGDLEVDGAPVDAQRGRREMFEADRPAIRTWGGLLTRKQISSSQLLHMLAFGGHLGAEQALLYTRLLSLLAIALEPPSGNAGTEQLKTFMCAIAVAGRLNAGVMIDS